MRHQNNFRKFSRSPSHRRAMLRNLATSLFLHEKIETTLPKAKDLRRVAEKMITDAFEDTVHRRRFAYGYLQDKAVVHKLFTEIAPRFKERTAKGGYTRVIRTRVRAGDAAEMALIELLSEVKGSAKAVSSKSKKSTKGAKADASVKTEEAEQETSAKTAKGKAKSAASAEKKESSKKATAPKKSKKSE